NGSGVSEATGFETGSGSDGAASLPAEAENRPKSKRGAGADAGASSPPGMRTGETGRGGGAVRSPCASCAMSLASSAIRSSDASDCPAIGCGFAVIKQRPIDYDYGALSRAKTASHHSNTPEL